MVAAVRAGAPEDAVLGLVPARVVEPRSVEEAADALRSCAGDRLAVVFAGGGTDLALGAPPRRLDVLLRTGRMARVVEHLPADQVVTVEAGMPLAALARHLAAHGQRLALDPPFPGRTTAGGAVAANAFGPLRHRFGAPRDLVLGVTLVRADGAVVRGGGKVVKNVAGFDLPRLMVGSCGTLALLATVTFRLHPLPEAEGSVRVDGLSPAGLRGLVRAMGEARLEPAAVAALVENGAEEDGVHTLGVRFEGFAPGVDEGRDRLLALASRAGHPAEALDVGAAAPSGRARRRCGPRARCGRSSPPRPPRWPRYTPGPSAPSCARSSRAARCSTRPSGSPSPRASRAPRRRWLARWRRPATRSRGSTGRSSSPPRRPPCGRGWTSGGRWRRARWRSCAG